jgi:hypothetical protein
MSEAGRALCHLRYDYPAYTFFVMALVMMPSCCNDAENKGKQHRWKIDFDTNIRNDLVNCILRLITHWLSFSTGRTIR